MRYRSFPKSRRALQTLMALSVIVCATFSAVLAQTTDGGTAINNQASATYSDGNGNNFSAVSNIVTVTVSNVAGLAITPDSGTASNVVAGQQNNEVVFTVTNTGNFSDRVRFMANGQSITKTGPVTITAAVIDLDGNNTVSAGDTDILTNNAAVESAAIARNSSIRVVVRFNVDNNASTGTAINIRLGDASAGSPTYDNQAADSSSNEVRTVATSSTTPSSVNGPREARGDYNSTVENDAQLRLTLTAPSTAVALGANITYTWQLENTGSRTATAQTLTNAPAGSNTGIFIFAPIPDGATRRTDFNSIGSVPAGVTVLYSTSPLTTAPLNATWTTSAPATLSDVTRVAFNVGSTLAAGATVSNINMVVTVKTGINATNPIAIIGDAFAKNLIGSNITDQSGDAISNQGDSNADFDEPNGSSGQPQYTPLVAVGNVLIGPNGQPAAVGPTNSNNDDYTNRSVTTGIAGIVPSGTTNAVGTVTFTNTIQNTGNANDTFTLTAPTVPTGFTVEASTNNGTSWTTLSGGGSTTLAINYGQQANVLVRVTAPAGQTLLTGFETVIRATSANTPAASNDTIDRLYTGFLRLNKSYTVTNGTGIGGATDPVPGAVIEYVITYTNVSSSGGTNNATLTANNIVITENGNAAPNNWGSTTDQVVGSASDSSGGTITGDSNGSTTLTDTIPTLGPGSSGTFRFQRVIR
jgi:hypothetical protein